MSPHREKDGVKQRNLFSLARYILPRSSIMHNLPQPTLCEISNNPIEWLVAMCGLLCTAPAEDAFFIPLYISHTSDRCDCDSPHRIFSRAVCRIISRLQQYALRACVIEASDSVLSPKVECRVRARALVIIVTDVRL